MAYSAALETMLSLSPDERRDVIKSMPEPARVRLLYEPEFWARPEQLWRPTDGIIHDYFLAGRGFGKTQVGAWATSYVAKHAEICGGRTQRSANDRDYGVGGWIGIAGRTANEVNETMLYGPSGLITCSPPWFMPRHMPSRKILIWPNGVVARLMSADVPDSFRGPNFAFLWTDEMAAWAKLKRALHTMRLSHRHGRRQLAVHTTTPVGYEAFLREIFAYDKDGNIKPAVLGKPSLQGLRLRPRVRVTTGSTYDNLEHLGADFLEDTVRKYEGTLEGDQELGGQILFDRPGAPWKRWWIHRCLPDDVPDLIAIVVAVDPTTSDGEQTSAGETCECGIVVLGLGSNGLIYVLEDASEAMSTKAWASRVAHVAERWGTKEIVAEDNQGGELVESAILTAAPRAGLHVRRVHATRDKFERAGLVAHLWEHGRVVHVESPTGGRRFVRLEHQMCTADPNKPAHAQLLDRMDALVWGMLALVGDGTDRARLSALSRPDAWRRIAEAMAKRFGGRIR